MSHTQQRLVVPNVEDYKKAFYNLGLLYCVQTNTRGENIIFGDQSGHLNTRKGRFCTQGINEQKVGSGKGGFVSLWIALVSAPDSAGE